MIMAGVGRVHSSLIAACLHHTHSLHAILRYSKAMRARERVCVRVCVWMCTLHSSLPTHSTCPTAPPHSPPSSHCLVSYRPPLHCPPSPLWASRVQRLDDDVAVIHRGLFLRRSSLHTSALTTRSHQPPTHAIVPAFSLTEASAHTRTHARTLAR